MSELNIPISETESQFFLPDGSDEWTFQHDNDLPSLPLPPLEATLQKYLKSVRPFVTDEEYANTEKIVSAFQNGIGRELNMKLAEKAANERNWVLKWWEEYAYLRNRTPLIPFCSMDGVIPFIPNLQYKGREDQIKNGALLIYSSLKFWWMIRMGRLRPSTSVDKTTRFCMGQFRRLYNTARIPGSEVDEIKSYFKAVFEGECPDHFILMCRGRFFKVKGLDSDGSLLSPTELATIIRKILTLCDSAAAEYPVGVLTCDERSSWYENRKKLASLSKNNAAIVDDIEKSIALYSFEDGFPTSMTELTYANFGKSYMNRWADKSSMSLIHANGSMSGISDHTAYDGIASVTMMHYLYSFLENSKGSWFGTLDTRQESTNIEELIFDLDDHLKSEIKRVNAFCDTNKKEFAAIRETFRDFGKIELKKTGIHPDTFIQMALQLTYVRMHGRLAPCYETATTRGFYRGRTETVRSCTVECAKWVNAMLNNNATRGEKIDLIRKAAGVHDKIMSEARNNAGCDRHLFGLQILAMEENLPMPEIFKDGSYTKSGGGGNFVLSTSLTGYTPIGGCVAPMCLDGYGTFYCILPNGVTISVSTNSKSQVTNGEKFFKTFSNSMNEIRTLLLDETQTSKL